MTLRDRANAAGLGCPAGCTCRGGYTGPERRKAPRHEADAQPVRPSRLVVRENDARRLLTLERQFCVFCWDTRGKPGTESYRAAQVICVAARLRYTTGSHAQREAAFRQYRRRALTAHLRALHPDVLQKLGVR